MKKRIVGQLSYPMTVDTWTNPCRPMSWIPAFIDLAKDHEIIVVGRTLDDQEVEMDLEGCRLIFTPVLKHLDLLETLDPDLVLWNDYPTFYRGALPKMPRTKHLIRMHGYYQQFSDGYDVYRMADGMIVPMTADSIKMRTFGVTCPMFQMPFGVNVPLLLNDKPWHERPVHFAFPANTEVKGRQLAIWMLEYLRARGFTCEYDFYRTWSEHAELLKNTKVLFVPSAGEGMCRSATEGCVSGCKLVVSAQSDCMIEQAGLLGGTAISTGLDPNHYRKQWLHQRDHVEIAEDLIAQLKDPPAVRTDWDEWSLETESRRLRSIIETFLP